jgi:hypothetical protein
LLSALLGAYSGEIKELTLSSGPDVAGPDSWNAVSLEASQPVQRELTGWSFLFCRANVGAGSSWCDQVT